MFFKNNNKKDKTNKIKHDFQKAITFEKKKEATREYAI